jgi:outer membrane protein OmpA-like peptidoglycan-associated protein
MTKSSAQLRQFGLILGLTMGVAACSTISDLDPTGLLGDSSDAVPASQFPDQAPPTATSDQDVGTTPDLASLPARPAPTATPGDRQQAAQSLASDGAQARYSGDALRGGTEAAAPPPAASEAASTAAQRILSAPDAPSTEATSKAVDAPPTASPTATEEPPTASPAAPPQAAAAPAPEPSQAPATGAQAAVAANAPVRTAAMPSATATPVGPSAGAVRGEPAVPANTPMRNGGTMVAAAPQSDAALGFKPSSAPPLDPSVSRFVSAPIVSRYRQTASLAGVPTAPAVPAVPSKAGGGSNDDVVANLDPASGAARVAAINGGVAPTAVIYFGGDGAALSKAAHAQVRAAVAAFKAGGGQGRVRVVGHASSRTANMSVEKHLETIFAKSQARANAVAQDLIRQGVPADKVLVDAVGDSQPVYYESMPKGEAGNRRAEIFVQS